jgi:hypothetical protein
MGINNRWLRRMGRFFGLFFEVSKGLSSVLAILVGLGIVSIAAGANTHSLYAVIFGVLLLIIVVGFAIQIYTQLEEIQSLHAQLREHQVTSYPATPLVNLDSPGDYPFKMLLKEVEYGCQDDLQTMWLKRHCIIEALHDGVQSYPDRYIWTGTPGTLRVFTRTPGFKIVNQRKDEIWNLFDISFPYPLQKGQRVEFTTEWSLFDDKRTAIPFLSTPIDFPTDHLILRIVIPIAKRPIRATAHRYTTYIDQVPIEAKELQYNTDTQSLEYDVVSPALKSKYMIRWWFVDADPM